MFSNHFGDFWQDSYKFSRGLETFWPKFGNSFHRSIPCHVSDTPVCWPLQPDGLSLTPVLFRMPLL